MTPARWLTAMVLALLTMATSVLAIRGGDDDDSPAARSQVAAAPTTAATNAPAAVAPSAPAAPAASTAAPEATSVVPAPAPVVRMGDRSSFPSRATTPRPAQAASLKPAPASAAAPAPSGAPPSSEPSEGAPSGGDRPPAGSAPGQPAPQPPGDAPKPPPDPDLISGTFEVSFGQAKLLVHVVPGPNPDLDVTVGESPVVGDAPPAERTGFTIGGSLAPGEMVPRPSGPAPGLGVSAPGWVAV